MPQRKCASLKRQRFRTDSAPSSGHKVGTYLQGRSQPAAVVHVCRRRMTLLWARRFCIVTAWVYVSNVTRLEAWRSNSCVTLMSVLLALNNEEYVCRKVCHPVCCVIPILAAAGRIIVRIRHCPQYGFRPRAAGLANTQSSALLYFVCSRHTLRASARRE